jgi:putative ABC transport system permease protein
MAYEQLFYRLMVRPLFREPVRLSLTVLAVALGVAVVLGIDLAGDAAAGSFHSSMETLAGDNELEIVATGGVPESVVATLLTEPYSLRVSPRMEDYAVVTDSKQTLPLIGVDLIAESSFYLGPRPNPGNPATPDDEPSSDSLRNLEDTSSIWVGSGLGKKPGEQIELLINDQTYRSTIRGVYPDPSGNDTAVLMDIAAAQRVLHRLGRVDRVLLKLPQNADPSEWEKRIEDLLPPGVNVRPQGTATAENRKMLAAFRWNLRLLSYIALVVGAFLIYNTISVSVVRRRAEIGIARALGASRVGVLLAFLGEAASVGLAGALLGLPLGNAMAVGAVKLMALTVRSLYVSSRPGPVALTASSVALGLFVGMGVAIASAVSPAREAMLVSPVEAMARGRREYAARINKGRDLLVAIVLAVLAVSAALRPAVLGKPVLGYLAALLLIAASAFAIPALVAFLSSRTSKALGRVFGVETLLASRSLLASLGRTSVLLGALSTAVAMMTSVGIMVGSFRQTVVSWMDAELPADFYLRPAGDTAPDRHPTISPELVDRIANLPGVAAVDRLRAYEISYEGMPATLASVDLRGTGPQRKSDFLSGRPPEEVLSQLRGQYNAIISEPFSYKHHVKAGDWLTLPLGESEVRLKIIDVSYDYASERGYIVVDRDVLLKYLPDPALSNLAVFVAPGVRAGEVRKNIEEAIAGHRILIFSDRDLRSEAIRIFDRTFAITYALEAVAVLVAVIGMAGALLALVIDRRRELGLLRFLGASSGQLRKLILVEAGLLGLVANLVGLVLGYFLSLVLVFVINKQSFGWTIRFHWPVEVLLGALTVVYLATVISGLYPAWIAVRLDPLEVVHEE